MCIRSISATTIPKFPFFSSSNLILRTALLIASSPSFGSPFLTPRFFKSSSSHPTIIGSNIFQISRLTSSSSFDNTMSEDPVEVPFLEYETLRDLVEYAVSFSAANGLQVQAPLTGSNNSVDDSKKSKSKPRKTYITAPISLLPQSYPEHLFIKATELARPLNELVDRISRDGEFLKDTLRDVRNVDEYTGKLLDMYEEIYFGERKGMNWGKHARTADRLGILRSDYMMHQAASDGEYTLKQVELNTIASSFAGLASTVASLHRFLTERLERDGKLIDFLEENRRCVNGANSMGVPESPAMIQLPLAISVAHDRYCKRFVTDQESKIDNALTTIIFVVQANESNTVDQRMLEFALWKNHQIPVLRMSLGEIYENSVLDENTGQLIIKCNGSTQKEVTVVYFRAGYAPSDYFPGGSEWLARERLERSRATKCPCLGYHLAGTKKVQQELARMGAVERFFPVHIDNTAQLLRHAFAGLFSLGADVNEEDLRAVSDVIFNGGEGRYVLKPQREGGGYNYYGKNLYDKLRGNCTVVKGSDGNDTLQLSPLLSEFILMERLFPPQQRAILLRNGQVEGTGMTISELGCFGTIVATEDSNTIHNSYGGFLLRTKFSGVDEGGVASGFATLSSPYLC